MRMSMSLVDDKKVPGDFCGELERFGSLVLGCDAAHQKQNAKQYREQLIVHHLCS